MKSRATSAAPPVSCSLTEIAHLPPQPPQPPLCYATTGDFHRKQAVGTPSKKLFRNRQPDQHFPTYQSMSAMYISPWWYQPQVPKMRVSCIIYLL